MTPDRPRGSLALTIALLAGLLAVYHANGDFLPGDDAKPHVYLAASLLREGNLTFTPREMPFMFHWSLRTPNGRVPRALNDWSDEIDGQPARALLDAGALTVDRPQYYIVPTVHPGEYAGAFGIGAGLVAVPVLTLASLFAHRGALDPGVLWYGGKLVAALCVAGSAVLVFRAALHLTSTRRALLVAIAYGLATNVWSLSSQQLYQHGPMELFLAAGALFIVRGLDRRGSEPSGSVGCDFVWSGLAFGAAMFCRPTGAVAIAAVLAYLAASNRRALFPFLAGTLPGVAALATSNTFLFGSPLRFGQGIAGEAIVLMKTGSPSVWQTPLWLGAAGALLSPSRGLFVFSPILLFSVGGAVVAFRSERWRALRPLALATLAIWLVEFAHFDWWSGWSYGYRHVVDTCVFLALLLIPAVDLVARRRALPLVFGLLLAWSAGVQVIGAFAYDLWGWNNPVAGYEVAMPGRAEPIVVTTRAEAEQLTETRGGSILRERRANIDLPENHHRLWSWSDCEIAYYARSFAASRALKREFMRQWLANPAL
jgi:Dolichyl-phosphate-mannose-protein mannosyltransferase